MKPLPKAAYSIALLLCLTATLHAQQASSGWMASDVGPNSRTLILPAATASVPGAAADASASPPQSRVVEIATGMNYWDGQRWSPSDPSFVEQNNGFAALRTQHRVLIQPNLNTLGAVTVTTRDGIVLNSTPVGIGLYDAASGQSAIIGTITNCAGVLVSTNELLFENAFDGVCADIHFVMQAGSFEQDVVLTGRVRPSDFGFPDATSRIQILTEFYGAPDPEEVVRPLYVEQDQSIRSQMADPDLVDHTLGFGEFVLGLGKAYAAPSSANPQGVASTVAKDFVTGAAGRKFLIESVPYNCIAAGLESLPDCDTQSASARQIRKVKGPIGYAAIPRPPSGGATAPGGARLPPSLGTEGNQGNEGGVTLAQNGRARLLPSLLPSPTEPNPRLGGSLALPSRSSIAIRQSQMENSNPGSSPRTARMVFPGPSRKNIRQSKMARGVTVDYIASIGGTLSSAVVFQGDTTYFVSSTVTCNSAATIEGGAVFKYKTNTGIILNSTLTCKTSIYRPAIFTGVDDDSVGDTLNGYTGSGYTGTINTNGYANAALYTAQTAMTFSNLRFRYAKMAIQLAGPTGSAYTVNHSQFVSCILGIEVTGSGCGSASSTARISRRTMS